MLPLRWIACVLCATAVSAQSPPGVPRMPAFDAESVTPSTGGSADALFEAPSGDRFTATNATLRDLIAFAYGVDPARLLGGPDWIAVERYDVVARTRESLPAWSGSGPPVPLLLMVRSLLADRFGLVVHQETRALPAYALIVARGDRRFGPGIAPSKQACEDSIATGAALAQDGGDSRCDARISPGQIVVRGRRMSQFASMLSRVVPLVVIDRTQLPGVFDFRLAWSPDADDRSLVSALREQLGLTIESTDAALEILVIDRVERPAAD